MNLKLPGDTSLILNLIPNKAFQCIQIINYFFKPVKTKTIGGNESVDSMLYNNSPLVRNRLEINEKNCVK